MTLHIYFARKFFLIFLGLFTVFFLLQALIDLIEVLRRLSDTEASFSDMVGLTLLRVPEGVNQILPLIMILATIALFLGLARSSELVVVRAAGRSGLVALIAPAAVALSIGLIAVSFLNPIIAASSKRYHDLYETWRNGGADVVSISSEGLWLRQGGEDGQTVIRASSANPQATVLYNVTFFSYAPNGGPLRRIEAREARLITGAWQLSEAKVWPLGGGINSEGAAQKFDQMDVPSTLTQDRIRDSFGAPNAISIWELPGFIKQLELAGFSARRHAVWFQMELARPVFLTAMVLLGAAFTMRHVRARGTGVAVLISLLLGFGLYYIKSFAQILGENGQIPVLLAAWAAPVAALMLAVGLLLHTEDG
ncbi:LPS export ABC transporter permease LptG [Rhodalgimonas zhirmunskyi]|uniref:LPS export ABC transporter permease LptG n=1 Tax=Rhodalgimonas zhirmunskyi TaxID=2964767 RepID=A0AAJ1X563_9RHOB|nr:LPS export ABC transporter permease LptG [Rhodoalgimonas zhirmunskyi]MDQ2093219.1 LPS export ABC transporter permease LptG [Rhodoalgimonas zhirmunskyi]